MKKILIIAIGLFTAGAANAQTSSNPDAVKFGIKAGGNYSNIIKTGDDNFKTEYKPGFHAGLTMEIPIVSSLAFAPEIVYSQKGYKHTGNDLLGNPTEYSVTTNFIDIPILAKIKAGNNFNVVVGPQVSFLASTTEKFTSGEQSYQNTVKEQNDNLKKSLVGGVVGFGYDFSQIISLNGRYALDLQKNNENGTSETPVYKNQVFQLGLGFKF
ncbi:MAG: porin family protein [Daejeonella sp.]